jgi:hypothetical protein
MEIHPERTVELTDLSRDDRSRLRPWVGLVLAGAFLALLASAAFGTEIPVHVIEHAQVKMRLLKGKCTDPVSLGLISQAPPQFQDGWKAISSQWLTKEGNWQEFAGCWLEVPKEKAGTPENVMVLVFSDGAVVQVLKSELLQKPGQKGA